MSIITPHEREMIDAAIEAGIVQKIPAGKSSDAHSFIYCRERHMLIIKDRAAADRNRGISFGRGGGAAPDPAVKQRREAVARRIHAGQSRREIAKALRVRTETITADARHMGLQFQKTARPDAIRLRERRNELCRAIQRNPGLIIAELARMTGQRDHVTTKDIAYLVKKRRIFMAANDFRREYYANTATGKAWE